MLGTWGWWQRVCSPGTCQGLSLREGRMNGCERGRRTQGVEPLSALWVWGRPGGNSPRAAPGVPLRYPQVPLARTQSRPRPEILRLLPGSRLFLGRWPILGMGVLAKEKSSTWFTFLGLHPTSDGIPIYPNSVVAGKEVKVLPTPYSG